MGSTTNTYLYTGEQFDPDLSFYYLRARYYSEAAGRFVSTDPHEGDPFEPVSLHRYLYANVDPVGMRDPSGASPPWGSVGCLRYRCGSRRYVRHCWYWRQAGPWTAGDLGRRWSRNRGGGSDRRNWLSSRHSRRCMGRCNRRCSPQRRGHRVGNTANALLLMHDGDVAGGDVKLQLGFYAGLPAGGLLGALLWGTFPDTSLGPVRWRREQGRRYDGYGRERQPMGLLVTPRLRSQYGIKIRGALDRSHQR